MLENTSTLTLNIPCLSPENFAKCESLLDAAMAKIPEITYFTTSFSANNVDKHLDFYFVAGSVSDYDNVSGETFGKRVQTTITFPKGGFSLTEAIDMVNIEFKSKNFVPSCISKL
jgi:hypothetical protein